MTRVALLAAILLLTFANAISLDDVAGMREKVALQDALAALLQQRGGPVDEATVEEILERRGRPDFHARSVKVVEGKVIAEDVRFFRVGEDPSVLFNRVLVYREKGSRRWIMGDSVGMYVSSDQAAFVYPQPRNSQTLAWAPGYLVHVDDEGVIVNSEKVAKGLFLFSPPIWESTQGWAKAANLKH